MPTTDTARSTRPRRRIAAAVGTVAGVAVALLALTAAAAWGHASGEVPQARLSADGPRITVVWTAAADDTADVVVAAGVWPEQVAMDYLDVAFGADIDVLPSAEEVAAASAHPALRRYLEERVRILQGGEPCTGTARPAADFVTDGATIEFACPEPVAEAVVEISLLHDRDPAYRTFSVDGTQQYAVHTARQPAHPWDFALTRQQGGGAPTFALLLGAGVVALLGGVVLRRVWRPAPARRTGAGDGRPSRAGSSRART